MTKDSRTLSELLRLGADPGALGRDKTYELWREAYTWDQLRLPAKVLSQLYFAPGGIEEEQAPIVVALEQKVGRDLARYLWAAA